MKVFVFMFLTIVVFGCSFKNNKTNQLKGQNLHGEIKTVRDVTYKAVEKFGEVTKGEKEDGMLNNTLSLYNRNGNREEFTVYDINDSIIQKYIYKYDNSDNLIEQIYFSGKTEVSKTIWKIDDNDIFVESITYDANGEIRDKTIPKYDNEGNLIEQAYYDSNGDLNSMTKYKYDKKGNNTEFISYNSDGSLNFRQLYKYNSKGNQTEEVSYNSHEEITGTTFFEYDNRNFKILEKHILADGTIDSYQTYKYNENGDWIEWNWNSLALTTYKYENDEKGNWVKKITYINKTPESVCERKIVYY